MGNAKKYLCWIIIGIIIVGGAVFSRFYVGSLEKQAANEHKTVADKFKLFKKKYEASENGLLQTPTLSDKKFGNSYMADIKKERESAITLLKRRAVFFDKCIVDGEVVYPEGYKGGKAGAKADDTSFVAFLRGCYQQTMADMENELYKKESPVWLEMLKQSIFAADAKMKSKDDAEKRAKASAESLASAQVRIVTPAIIPVSDQDDFRSEENRQKRWQAWRQFLVFQDIMKRVVPNAQAEVTRNVVGFARAKPEAGVLETPETEIYKGVTTRFIQNISELRVEPLSVGDAVIPEPLALQNARKPAPKEDEEEESDSEEKKEDVALAEEGKYSDVYKITVKLTAHPKVIKDFQKRILETDDLYYVPLAAGYMRFAEKDTMGGYALPNKGATVGTITADEVANTKKAVDVIYTADYSYEPPVTAQLEYLLYRPRFAGSSNPEPEVAEE